MVTREILGGGFGSFPAHETKRGLLCGWNINTPMNPIVYLTILFFGIVIFFLWYEIAVARRMRKEDEEADRRIKEIGHQISEKKKEIAKFSRKTEDRPTGRALRQAPLNSVSRQTPVEHHRSSGADPLMTMLLWNAALNNSVSHDPPPSSDHSSDHHDSGSSSSDDCGSSDSGSCDCGGSD